MTEAFNAKVFTSKCSKGHGYKMPTLMLIYLICFLDLLVVGLTVPLIGLHLKSLGASHFMIGLLSSLYSLLQIFSGPLIGSWSDVRGRESVLSIILLICSILYTLMGLTKSLLLIFLSRSFLGLFKHVQSLCKATVADLIPLDQQPGAFAKASAFGTLGFLVGPSLGGHLYELPNGFFVVCLLTSVICICNICLTLFLPTSSAKQNRNAGTCGSMARMKAEFSKALSEVIDLEWTIYWKSFFLKFLFGLTINIYFENQAWYLRERFNLSQRHIGYIISFFSAIGTVSAFLLDKITDWFYENDIDCTKRLSHSFNIISASILLLYFSTNIYIFLVFLVPVAISSTALRVISMEYILKQSRKTNRGSLSGASHSTVSLARSITPFITGIIFENYGTQITLLLSSIPTIVGAIFCYNVRNHHLKKS